MDGPAASEGVDLGAGGGAAAASQIEQVIFIDFRKTLMEERLPHK